MSIENNSTDPTNNLRELLRLSQTDVTPSHTVGLSNATIAYDIALSPENIVNDPTAAGEAAAKAALRSAQAGKPESESEMWLSLSFEALKSDSPKTNRERIATNLLAGRLRALNLLNQNAPNRDMEYRALKAFEDAETGIMDVRKNGITMPIRVVYIGTDTDVPGMSGSETRFPKLWDPYATMLSVHKSTFEALRQDGNARKAGRIAIAGINRALHSDSENNNSPESKQSRVQLKHLKFIAKHVLLNTAALGLATTRPLNVVKPVSKGRRKLALHILG